MRVYVTLSKADYRLAAAYAKDRGIPIGTLAGASLMNDVKRSINRSHLREAVFEDMKAWVLQNMPALLREAHMAQYPNRKPSDALAPNPARAER